MSPVFLLRLALDCIAAGLLLFAFAYHLGSNAAHEIVGSGIFLFVFIHNLFHRRWFANLPKGIRERRGKFNIAITALLIAGMVALLISSLVISETMFPSLRIASDFTARQAHGSIAYWLLVIAGIHLGLRWPLLISVARKLLRIVGANATRSVVLRLIAVGIAIQGVRSSMELNLRSRLMFQVTLDWWNFEESAMPFFFHCMAVAGSCMFVTYYTMQLIRRHSRTTATRNLAT